MAKTAIRWFLLDYGITEAILTNTTVKKDAQVPGHDGGWKWRSVPRHVGLSRWGKVGGLAQNMTFFQMVPKSFLSVLIHSTRCKYDSLVFFQNF